MPFNTPQRRDSWPPTIVRIPASAPNDLSLIDENPISFFLSPPEDIDDFLFDEDLTAGIESSRTPKRPIIREISPSSLQRLPRLEEAGEEDEEEEEQEDFEAPMTLKDFTDRHTSGRQSRTGQNSDGLGLGLGLGLGITLPDNAAMRGRARIRLPPRGRGAGRARTLSARRPQSWVAPSPEIFRIDEEKEEENENDQKTQGGVDMDRRSASSPGAVSGGGILRTLSPSPSLSPSLARKKRVRWADIED